MSYNIRSLFVRKSATVLTVLGSRGHRRDRLGRASLSNRASSLMFTSRRPRAIVAIFLRPGRFSNEGNSQFSRDRGLKLIKSRARDRSWTRQGAGRIDGGLYLAVLLPRAQKRGGLTNIPLRGVQPMTFDDARHDEVRIVEGRNFTPGHGRDSSSGARLVDRVRELPHGRRRLR